jgi:hypothetical protein
MSSSCSIARSSFSDEVPNRARFSASELRPQPVDQRVARAQRGGLGVDDRMQGGGVGRQRIEANVHIRSLSACIPR